MQNDSDQTVSDDTLAAPGVSSAGEAGVGSPERTMDAPGVSVADPASQATVDSTSPDAFADAFTGSGVSGPKLPERIGRYYPLKLLGEGGMGAVYKAEQREPIKRLVALKIIRLGHESAGILARFDSERQALARMDHPSIAKVLDAGSDNGLPFFVMEYVPGVPITEFADQNCLSLRARLELFLQVCDGISHAHSKALLHRDIKAQNVLAYMADGKPAVKVIDFGIAKAVGEEKLTNATLTANVGSVLGTPYAMSPEQADGSADLDTRTDVYALGVLLYELLGGRLPFALEELQRKTLREVLDLVRLKEPPKLSTWLAQAGEKAEDVAKARATKPATLIRDLKKELEWIPLKAMRKDRDRRYQSALQLAEDIENYIADRPLTAGPESAVYVFKKFVGRNKLRLAVAAAILALIVSGTTYYTIRIRIERDNAYYQTKLAAFTNDYYKSILQLASPDEGFKDIKVSDAMKIALGKLDLGKDFSGEPGLRADLRLQVGSILCDSGAHDLADEQLNDALRDCLKARSSNDINVAKIYSELATNHYRMGNFKDAIIENGKALGIYKYAAPSGSADVARTMNNLGTCFTAVRDFDKAVDQLNKSLAMLDVVEKRDFAVRDEVTELRASVLHNLGAVASEKRDYKSALGYFQRALPIRERLAPNTPDLADTLMDLGNTNSAMGCFEVALPLLQRALAIYHDHGGDDWLRTLKCRETCCTALRGSNQLAEAEKQYRLCITGFTPYPEMASDLAAVKSGLGNTLLLMPGREAEAETPLLEAFDYRVKAKDPRLGNTVKALDALYQKTNQPDKAKIIHDRLAAAGVH